MWPVPRAAPDEWPKSAVRGTAGRNPADLQDRESPQAIGELTARVSRLTSYEAVPPLQDGRRVRGDVGRASRYPHGAGEGQDP